LQIGKTVELMAAAEGLDAHRNAVSIRLMEKI
jgi:histidinol dehydrogenase